MKETKQYKNVPSMLRNTNISMDQMRQIRNDIDSGLFSARIDIAEQFTERLWIISNQYKSFHSLSQEVALFEILMIIIKKCETSPMGAEEMKVILGKSDILDYKTKAERLMQATKRTWLKLILDEIIGLDISGQYCQLLTLGHLWRYNPLVSTPTPVQFSDLMMLHYFIKSNFGFIIQTYILLDSRPEVGVVFVDPIFKYDLELVEDAQRRVHATIIQILQIQYYSTAFIEKDNPKQITDPLLIASNLIVSAKRHNKTSAVQSSTQCNIIKDHYETLGRIYIADYLIRYHRKLHPMSVPFPKCVNASGKNSQNKLTCMDFTKSQKIKSIMSDNKTGGCAIPNIIISPTPENKKIIKRNETRDRTEEFAGLKAALANLQTGSHSRKNPPLLTNLAQGTLSIEFIGETSISKKHSTSSSSSTKRHNEKLANPEPNPMEIDSTNAKQLQQQFQQQQHETLQQQLQTQHQQFIQQQQAQQLAQQQAQQLAQQQAQLRAQQQAQLQAQQQALLQAQQQAQLLAQQQAQQLAQQQAQLQAQIMAQQQVQQQTPQNPSNIPNPQQFHANSQGLKSNFDIIKFKKSLNFVEKINSKSSLNKEDSFSFPVNARPDAKETLPVTKSKLNN